MRLLNKVIKASQYDQFSSDITGNDLGYQVTSASTGLKEKETLDKAFQKAKEIVDAAQDFSSKQMQEATEKIEKEFAQAKESGYNDGFSRGLEEGKKSGFSAGKENGYDEGFKNAAAENRKSLDELASMIENVDKTKTKILQKFESGLEDLAFSMARKILKSELKTNKNAIRSIITNAMDSYRNQAWVRIYVSNDTASILLKSDNNIIDILKDVSDNIKIIPEQGMDDGDCVLEMPDKVVDAGMDSQLKKFKTAIDSKANNTQK